MSTPEQFLITRIGRVTISTVYAAGGVEPPTPRREPRQYETLVFDETGQDPVEYDAKRYHTERAARDGHASFVRDAMRGKWPRC